MRRSTVPAAAFAALILSFVSSPAAASVEPGATAAVAGEVLTPDGRGVPHVRVVFENGSARATVPSGAEGRFRILLKPGDYAVTVDAPGFMAAGDPHVSAAAGAEAHMVVRLDPAPVRERVTVTAARGDAAASTLGVATSTLEADEIRERHASDVAHLLPLTPGIAVARTGAVGVQTSAFVRGGNFNATRVLIDGVPVNEPGGRFNWGGVMPLELERIEVVRGAASGLYGTDALAGVIQLTTRRAAPGEPWDGRLELEGGEHRWRRIAGGTTGRTGRLDWNAGLARLTTDNEAPNSAFAQMAGALTVGLALSSGAWARGFARMEDGEAGTPGQVAFGRPDLDASFEKTQRVLAVEVGRSGGRVNHEARAGYSRHRELSLNPLDSGSYVPSFEGRVGAFPLSDFPDPAGYLNDTARTFASYQAEVAAGRHLLTGGVDLERETGELGSRAEPPLSPRRTNAGLFVQDRLVIGARLFVTAGARAERNASFGTRVVPRGSVAWQVRGGADPTILRAAAGAGIKEPTFFESFGASFFARGNPDLAPERSRTYDLGLEQRAFASRLSARVTAFHHDYREQVAYTVTDFVTFAGTFVNLGHTRARGLEVEVEAAPTSLVRLQAQYTRLDGEVIVSTSDFDPLYAPGRRLLRRPKHSGAATLRVGSLRRHAAVSAFYVGRRADGDFLNLGLEENPAFTRIDARAGARFGRRLDAFVVAENLLDRAYMEALGYPALGRSVRLGLTLRAGGPRP